MLPLIIETTDPTESDAFLSDFIRKHHIAAYNIFTYAPAAKEFSIKEIREIIGETVHHSNEHRLFHLQNFDTASPEAQNAFLKTLEEHQPTIYFILTVEHAARLLPTIRSRANTVTLTARNHDKTRERFGELIGLVDTGSIRSALSVSNRVNKTEIGAFLDALTEFYRSHLDRVPSAPRILREIMSKQNLVKHNNLDPQTALDSVLLLCVSKRQSADA